MLPTMLPRYVVLDLETTGGSGGQDRITEIAAVRVEGGQVTARFSTLLDPATPIPPFIERLTGITNAMVQGAPSFKSISDQVLALLDDAVLVAHNAAFDHGFLKGEFARLGHALSVPTLCTVRLSRKLYPQFKSHGLDALMQRHHLSTDARHRAMGDVQVVLAWLAQMQLEHGAGKLTSAAQALVRTIDQPDRPPPPQRTVPLSAVHPWPLPCPVWIQPVAVPPDDDPLPWELVFHWQLWGRATDDDGMNSLDQEVTQALGDAAEGQPLPLSALDSPVNLADYRRWSAILKKEPWRWRPWRAEVVD